MTMPPMWYFAVSMATDTLYTLLGGWLCAVISRRDVQATIGLIIIGEVMGLGSTFYLWSTVPALLQFLPADCLSAWPSGLEQNCRTEPRL